MHAFLKKKKMFQIKKKTELGKNWAGTITEKKKKKEKTKKHKAVQKKNSKIKMVRMKENAYSPSIRATASSASS